MTTSPANPKVETIRQNVRKSYIELKGLIDGPVAAMRAEGLYKVPSENEWTVMENLAHIVEFMPYWANEAVKLVAEPGRNFGRTKEDQARQAAIREHAGDTLAWVRTALPESYQRLDEVLSGLKDSDLELTGQHVKFGEKSLEQFIEEFVAKHLRDHVEQISECLGVVGQNK